MSNVLSGDKQQQVLALGRLGWSLRRIERETGVRRETVGAYLRAAGIAVRPPGSWGRGAPAKPANEVTPGSEPVSASLSTCVRSSCEPFRDFIELSLGQGRNATAIWQDLVASHGNYQSVKRYVRKLCGKQTPEARVVIQTAPGEEAQVDYGSGPMVRDPLSGKYRRTRLFVMTLGYSRKCVRFLVFRSSTRIWADERGAFSVGEGPAFEPWKDWKVGQNGPLALVRAAIIAASPRPRRKP